MKTDDEKTRLSMVGRQSLWTVLLELRKRRSSGRSRDNDQPSCFVRSPSNCLKKIAWTAYWSYAVYSNRMQQAISKLEAVLHLIARGGIYQMIANKTPITFQYKIIFNNQQIITHKPGNVRFCNHAFPNVKYGWILGNKSQIVQNRENMKRSRSNLLITCLQSSTA